MSNPNETKTVLNSPSLEKRGHLVFNPLPEAQLLSLILAQLGYQYQSRTKNSTEKWSCGKKHRLL